MSEEEIGRSVGRQTDFVAHVEMLGYVDVEMLRWTVGADVGARLSV